MTGAPALEPKGLLVHFAAEGGEIRKIYDLARLPLSRELQDAFAEGFRELTGPSGSRRTASSADSALRLMRKFAVFLSELDYPPTAIEDLAGHHADAARLRFGSQWMDMRSTLRAAFLGRGGVSPTFQQKLLEPFVAPRVSDPVHSYSFEEHRLVMRAARQAVQAAYERVVAAHARVEAFRNGRVPDGPTEYATLSFQRRVLDHGYPKKDSVSRTERDAFTKLGIHREPLARELFLTVAEMGALVTLMVGITGENLSQVLTLPARHHRADRQDGIETPVTLSRASKPRRGAAESEMTIALTGSPTWEDEDIGAEERPVDGSSRMVDLRSAFGVHSAAEIMCRDARRLAASDRLIVGFGRTNREDSFRPVTEGHVFAWYKTLNIVDSSGQPVRPDSRRLRRTFVEAKQKPVAHSIATFVNTYLLRDRGNIGEYQRIVSRVLSKEVARAKTAVTRIITASTVELASSDPEAAAVLVGTDPGTLGKALSGDLDTVMTSCLDNTHSPFSPAGSPCGASFMLCLGCPNARAEPRHLPVQLLVFHELEARRREIEPIEWATKFAIHHARLQNLFNQFPDAIVNAARGTETEDDTALVRRFLGRELDVK